MLCRKLNFLLIFYFIIVVAECFAEAPGRKKDQYLIGTDEKLMFTVHIFGEVKKPGEYLVTDDTNLLELISKAGGPTEYSNLSKVKLTRGLMSDNLLNKSIKKVQGNSNKNLVYFKHNKTVNKINLKKLLNDENFSAELTVLQPGDVISIGRNTWFKWQTIIRIFSQTALIGQALWYWSQVN